MDGSQIAGRPIALGRFTQRRGNNQAIDLHGIWGPEHRKPYNIMQKEEEEEEMGNGADPAPAPQQFLLGETVNKRR